jgi:hypothetical protein
VVGCLWRRRERASYARTATGFVLADAWARIVSETRGVPARWACGAWVSASWNFCLFSAASRAATLLNGGGGSQPAIRWLPEGGRPADGSVGDERTRPRRRRPSADSGSISVRASLL